MRTNWDLMVSGNALISEKNARKKIFVSKKIATKDLVSYVDDGWEKSKDFKSPKYVGITKEKPVQKQFEDTAKMWNDIHMKLKSQIEIYDEKHAKEI